MGRILTPLQTMGYLELLTRSLSPAKCLVGSETRTSDLLCTFPGIFLKHSLESPWTFDQSPESAKRFLGITVNIPFHFHSIPNSCIPGFVNSFLKISHFFEEKNNFDEERNTIYLLLAVVSNHTCHEIVAFTSKNYLTDMIKITLSSLVQITFRFVLSSFVFTGRIKTGIIYERPIIWKVD